MIRSDSQSMLTGAVDPEPHLSPEPVNAGWGVFRQGSEPGPGIVSQPCGTSVVFSMAGLGLGLLTVPPKSAAAVLRSPASLPGLPAAAFLLLKIGVWGICAVFGMPVCRSQEGTRKALTIRTCWLG